MNDERDRKIIITADIFAYTKNLSTYYSKTRSQWDDFRISLVVICISVRINIGEVDLFSNTAITICNTRNFVIIPF